MTCSAGSFYPIMYKLQIRFCVDIVWKDTLNVIENAWIEFSPILVYNKGMTLAYWKIVPNSGIILNDR